ncbi:hypothetical protein DdX_15429 [Ditylenchus destructor]|uniref:Uncharacterized protein n=1 Tax=Ditylenchus destructor TaxID=166010 RepID=A0AAD4MQB9_9BILA|nr:hypothetical protein DdX_15429 [Ditylenchus destructor]
MSAKQQGKDPKIGPYKDMDTPKGLDEAGVWMPDKEKSDKRNSLMQDTTKNVAYKSKEGEFQSPTSGKESRPTMHLTEGQKSDMYKYAGLGAVAVGGIYVARKLLRK